jgi:hypothetical protein
MSKFLANENVPLEAVELARQHGIDLSWIAEISPGADDDAVLALSLSDGRVLVTFDKDFGDMAFHQGKQATCGIILLRPRLRSPQLFGAVLGDGGFTVCGMGRPFERGPGGTTACRRLAKLISVVIPRPTADERTRDIPLPYTPATKSAPPTGPAAPSVAYGSIPHPTVPIPLPRC